MRAKQMKPDDIEIFKASLLKSLKDFQQRSEDTIPYISDQQNQSPESIDRAAIASDRNFYIRLKSREGKLIQKIEKALDRIEEGSYGICETCGEDISLKRLKARPVTEQCIECKTATEAADKLIGV
jgi:DnaK suppressor protein